MSFRVSKKWSRTTILLENSSKINTVAISDSKPFFATGSSDSTICLWDKHSFNQILSLKGHQGSLNKIIIEKKSGNLITGGEGVNIFSWNIEYEKVNRVFRGHTSSINCINIHPTLNIMVSGSRDNSIRIWDLRMKKEALIIKHHKNQITSVIFNHESPHLISSSKDSRVCLWDIIAFECTTCLISHPSGVRETKLHPIELKFASLCSQTLNIWRLDGLNIKKLNIFKNVSLFSFKKHNEFVTVDKLGWMKFFKWKKSIKLFNFQYGFSPFGQNSTTNPTTIQFNSESNRFIICNDSGEIGIFKNKWLVKI